MNSISENESERSKGSSEKVLHKRVRICETIVEIDEADEEKNY